jgi:hypothetical protein
MSSTSCSGPSLARHLVQLRGLVAEHDGVRLVGHVGVRAGRLAADLLREGLSAAVVHIGHEHGLTPPARKRGGHVACPYEPDSHQRAKHMGRKRGGP